ncbi:MAG: HD domain-containing protein [Syntrophobacteraceae bacterium]
MAAAPSSDLLKDFHKGIFEFAREFVDFPRYGKRLPKGPKIIHDPLWGTIKLEAWEVALLDLPLFQRLRQIHQISLASYVFPGCNHIRFEHTLGGMRQTRRLIAALNCHYPAGRPRFELKTLRTLRLAALFHDCGHSCFSHITEELYGACPDMLAFLQSGQPLKARPHEILSSLILRSAPVKDFLGELEDEYGIEIDIERAADWIIGKSPQRRENKIHCEAQVINGPFDADKLDYILRDAHYSGIPIGVDLERLWAFCKVDQADNGAEVLSLDEAGVASLEQILFAKINLFAIVYHHPKIRAAEKMVQSLIERAKEEPELACFHVCERRLDLNRAAHYLWLTDEVFFCEASRRKKEDPVRQMLHDIRYRRFFVRALSIATDTVGAKCREEYGKLRKLSQPGVANYKAKRALAQEILTASGLEKEIGPGDIWVDLPAEPSFKEVQNAFVRTAAGTLRKASDFFPVHYWSDSFKDHKWRGHVFCPPEHQQRVHEAALEVFARYGLRFEKSAGLSCHVAHPKATV